MHVLYLFLFLFLFDGLINVHFVYFFIFGWEFSCDDQETTVWFHPFLSQKCLGRLRCLGTNLCPGMNYKFFITGNNF